MEVFKKVISLQKYLSKFDKNTRIGFVPTMGALHKGHLSLIEIAQKENDITVVSIFVNPTQFNKTDDLKKYPRTLEKDLGLLKKIKCDVVFTPDVKEMYATDVSSSKFDFKGLENVMEGAFRAGHFDGVGTVVKKLLEIVNPTNAYFGEKDFQQLQIIKTMVETEDLPINIIGCDIFREDDGLAMSSRNTRLTDEQRNAAPLIHQTLLKAKEMFRDHSIESIQKMVQKTFENSKILDLEYFEIADTDTLKPAKNKKSDLKYRGFMAVNVGTIRLIDNIALN